MSSLVPVILSGGSGARLWPLSRSLFPKQLLPLTSESSLIQETILRVDGPGFGAPVIVCNDQHRFVVAEQMRGAGIRPAAIILEPEGRNTAPAAALAALSQSDPEAILLVMPADHVIRDQIAFLAATKAGRRAAEDDRLVTFGVPPRGPETGYGYIQRGVELYPSSGIFSVARFVEKPDSATAQSYLTSGDYSWNSGLFMFRVSAYLAELERLAPQMLAACRTALATSRPDLDFVRLDDAAFRACPSDSIDYAVMEKTSRAAVMPVEMGWDDIGSWQALWDTAPKDSDANVVRGDVLTYGTRRSYLRSEGPLLAAVGVEDLVIVATSDAVLVSRRSEAQNVKKIVEQLAQRGRDLHVTHRKVNRPWGTYEGLDGGENFQVKRITVNPGARLSLQKHHKRAEHWIVVSGTALVTCGDKTFELAENQSTYIPLGEKHRLENPGSALLTLIEVQSGSYLGEDDIVRFEDSYGR